VTHLSDEVIEDHLATVYRYALRLAGRADIAEDLTQETMLRAWGKRYSLRDERTIRVWLLRIATNLWTDHLRQTKYRPRVLVDEPCCPGPSPAALVQEHENVRRALAAMDTLPNRQRQVLYLITCEQLTQDEAAQVLGIERSAVKASLSLARKELRLKLKDIYRDVCGRTLCEEKQS
jgi:RNA polymerase sigma-70 factor (ECF subfamily)